MVKGVGGRKSRASELQRPIVGQRLGDLAVADIRCQRTSIVRVASTDFARIEADSVGGHRSRSLGGDRFRSWPATISGRSPAKQRVLGTAGPLFPGAKATRIGTIGTAPISGRDRTTGMTGQIGSTSSVSVTRACGPACVDCPMEGRQSAVFPQPDSDTPGDDWARNGSQCRGFRTSGGGLGLERLAAGIFPAYPDVDSIGRSDPCFGALQEITRKELGS